MLTFTFPLRSPTVRSSFGKGLPRGTLFPNPQAHSRKTKQNLRAKYIVTPAIDPRLHEPLQFDILLSVRAGTLY